VTPTKVWDNDFAFDKLSESETTFKLTVQVTNPDTIMTGSMVFVFFNRYDNEKIASKSFTDCFETETAFIEGNALKLALGWGINTPEETADAEAFLTPATYNYVYITPTACSTTESGELKTLCTRITNNMQYTFSIPTTNSANTDITDDRIPEDNTITFKIPKLDTQKLLV